MSRQFSKHNSAFMIYMDVASNEWAHTGQLHTHLIKHNLIRYQPPYKALYSSSTVNRKSSGNVFFFLILIFMACIFQIFFLDLFAVSILNEQKSCVATAIVGSIPPLLCCHKGGASVFQAEGRCRMNHVTSIQKAPAPSGWNRDKIQ